MIERTRALTGLLCAAALGALALPSFAAERVAGGSPLPDVVARVRSLRAGGHPAVVVFGLDQVLFDPAARTRDIFTRALDGPGSVVTPEQPALAEQVQSLPLARHAFAPESTLARAGITDTAMVRALVVRWNQDAFSNRFLLDDEALPGAVRFVDSLYAAGATIVYLDRRDAPHMLGGTAQGLLERGFPVGVARTLLVLKPDRRQDDASFYRDVTGDVAALGEVAAVFAADPRALAALAERFPHAAAFALDRPHAPGSPPPPSRAVHLADFSGFAP